MGAKEPKFEKVRRFVVGKPYTTGLLFVLFIAVMFITFFTPGGWLMPLVILGVFLFIFIIFKITDEIL